MANLQTEILAEVIAEKLSPEQYPYDDNQLIISEVDSALRNIHPGDTVAVLQKKDELIIRKVAGLQDLTTIDRDSILIPYALFERRFYENINA